MGGGYGSQGKGRVNICHISLMIKGAWHTLRKNTAKTALYAFLVCNSATLEAVFVTKCD